MQAKQSTQHILVGVDCTEDGSLTEGSRLAAQQALHFAALTCATTEFLYATASPSGPHSLHEGLARALAKLVEETAPEVLVRSLVVANGDPEQVLIHWAQERSADLVVVAKRNQSRRDDRRFGSVSMKLLRNCPVPLWIVKPDSSPGLRCILAATDLSPVGDLATDYAARMAAAEDCDLCVVHAWSVPMEVQLASARVGDEETAKVVQRIAQDARDHIKRQSGVATLGSRAKIYAVRDDPAHAIVNGAQELQPDLVVMGTVSRGGLAGFVIGNTAERVLYELDCSILTLKPRDFVCPHPAISPDVRRLPVEHPRA